MPLLILVSYIIRM